MNSTNETNIEQHREAIDEIDKQLVQLLNERTKHALAIGAIKTAAKQEVYVPHRELSVLKRICKLNNGPISDESLRTIFAEIMSSALALQKTMTISYLGPEATFTHQAAIRRFGSSLRYSPQKTITDVFMEVEQHHADYGVVPVENSTEGVVTSTLDMFVDSELKIVAQILTPIQHCLVGRPGTKRFNKLFSHPQALAQCRNWMQKNLPTIELVETSSTTRAAELAAKEADSAAIASSLAAEKYGLEIFEFNIQDSHNNVTRFLVLGRRCSPSTGNDRTSLMFSVRDQVGALHDALTPFHKYGLNMSKIESRPSKRKAWEYLFFVDVDGHYNDKHLENALNELQKQCNFVKVLGSYPNSD
ncbi:MAG: prephenate dehydratase [Verrucomicrobia bacterium]|nr:prephenate dehydratase [Verrucomicrobiota bacterium]